MKKHSPFLFELIKSLTVSEKRYFHLFATRHYPENNHSLRLFRILAKQEKYDESAALAEMALPKNNFAVQKNILHRQLLNAMVQFDSAGNAAIRLQQDVFACQILLQKGLTAQARYKLKQLRPEADKFELHEIALQAQQVEAAIFAREQYKGISEQELCQWQEENLKLCHKIEMETLHKYTLSRAQKIQLAAGGKSTAYAESVKDLLRVADANAGLQVMTTKARMDLLQTRALYHFMAKDTDRAFEINGNFIALMEAEPHWINFYPQRYFSALNNYLIDCFVLKNESALQQGLEKMRALKGHAAFRKTANLEPNIFRITYQLELNYLIAKGSFSAALPLLKGVQQGLLNYGEKIPLSHRMNLEYLMAYVLFGVSRFEEASALLDKIQQYKRPETAALVDSAAAIMQVICHYEMGNFSILDSLVKSCKRKLKEREGSIPSKLEIEVLNTVLSFSAKVPAESDWQRLWQKLCMAGKDAKPRSAHNDYFDLFHYVYAKAEKLKYEKT